MLFICLPPGEQGKLVQHRVRHVSGLGAKQDFPFWHQHGAVSSAEAAASQNSLHILTPKLIYNLINGGELTALRLTRNFYAIGWNRGKT